MSDPECDYLIDSLNPATWNAAFRRIRDHAPDLVIVPWWTIYWAPCFWYLACRCRRAGIKVRFLCHNVGDHETAAWKLALTRAVLRQGDSFIVQAVEEERRLRSLLPNADVTVHPHPIYDQFPNPDPTARLARRGDLELLFYGFVRPYKGLDLLIEGSGAAGG